MLFGEYNLHTEAFAQSKLPLRFRALAARTSAEKDDGWICPVILLKLFLLPADTRLLSALGDMYQPAVSLWGQTIFKDGNISVLALSGSLSAPLYGQAASLKAFSLFIPGLPALAAITLQEKEKESVWQRRREKGPFVDFKRKDLVRAPAFGMRVASFCLSLFDERFQGPLRSDSGSDSLPRNEPENAPSAGHGIMLVAFLWVMWWGEPRENCRWLSPVLALTEHKLADY